MAGANFTIEVDDAAPRGMLDRLLAFGGDLTPAFSDIGEYLLNSHRQRFADQQAPDGTSWQPLSPKYQARKKKNRDKILVFEGWLVGRLGYDARPDELVFGTPMIYGATHHFGDPGRNIPARPFLGLSNDDRGGVLDILRDHAQRAAEG